MKLAFVVSFILVSFTNCYGDSARQVRNVVAGYNRKWQRGEVVYKFNSLIEKHFTMKKLSFAALFILALFSNCYVDSAGEVRNDVKNQIWPHGEVIYKFNSGMVGSQKQIIKDAMQEINTDTSYHGRSCVSFLPKEGFHGDDDDFVLLTNSPDRRCSVRPVEKIIYLGDDCMTRTGVIPLLLLTLGLYREHQRPDRDRYIHINYNNIKTEDQLQFNKIAQASTNLLGLCYDYNSITHFGPYAYAVDLQKPTITANASDVPFGSKTALSVSDVKKVQILYKCGLDTSHIKGRQFQIDCTFENPVCGLVASIRTAELWSKSKNNSLVHGEHTRGKGHFMYSNSSGTQLLTLRYIREGLFCIQFAFFRLNSSANVALHAELPDSSVPISNTSQFQDTDRWVEYEISVNAKTYWRLIIEASVGQGSNGIAIDDVSVTEDWCENWCKSTPITLM